MWLCALLFWLYRLIWICEVYVSFWSQFCLETDLNFWCCSEDPTKKLYLSSSRRAETNNYETPLWWWLQGASLCQRCVETTSASNVCALTDRSTQRGISRAQRVSVFLYFKLKLLRPTRLKSSTCRLCQTLTMSSEAIQAVMVDSISFNGTFVATILRGMVHRLQMCLDQLLTNRTADAYLFLSIVVSSTIFIHNYCMQKSHSLLLSLLILNTML